MVAYEDGFYQEVIDLLETDIKLKKNVDHYLILAYSYSRIHDPNQAVLYYEKSRSELWPFSSKYMLDYGDVLRQLERYDEAIEVYQSMGDITQGLIYSCRWSKNDVLNDRNISLTQIPISEI